MANDEQRDISTSPQEPVPAPAEEQQHEGSFAPSERNPAAHPQDTDNLEHDHQAVYGAAPADEATQARIHDYLAAYLANASGPQEN